MELVISAAAEIICSDNSLELLELLLEFGNGFWTENERH